MSSHVPTDLISCAPMRGELAWSQAVRMAWLNGVPNAFDVLPHRQFPRRGMSVYDETACGDLVDILRLPVKLSRPKYLLAHSMVGILGRRTTLAWDVKNAFHGQAGYLKHQVAVRSCEECMKECFRSRGFGWFQRRHQLIGDNWCPDHGLLLSRHPHRSEQVSSLGKPSQWISSTRVRSDWTSLDAAPPIVTNFVSILRWVAASDSQSRTEAVFRLMGLRFNVKVASLESYLPWMLQKFRMPKICANWYQCNFVVRARNSLDVYQKWPRVGLYHAALALACYDGSPKADLQQLSQICRNA